MTPRYSPRRSIQAIASFSTSDDIGHGHIHDLSVPGCRLETTASLCVGQTVNLQLYVMPRLTSLRVPLAVVRWIKSPWAGLEFIGMSPADQIQLRRLVGYRDALSPSQWRPLAG